jgi:cyclopropane fatty-acyl-phospholipid synthase-like methyltransferase
MPNKSEMSMSKHLVEKPDTLKQNKLREWIKIKFLSNHLRLFPINEKTLDIGCGWGFSRKINPNFYFVDADVDCIEFLKSLGAKAFLADVSAELPFDDGFFDNAFNHDVLEHLDEDECLSLFKKVNRVLKKGGTFMIVVPNYKGYLTPGVGHKRFVTEKEILDAALPTGFKMVRKWHTPFPAWIGDMFSDNKLVCILEKL